MKKIIPFIFITLLSFSSKCHSTELTKNIHEFSGVYEGNLEFFFADGGATERGQVFIYIDDENSWVSLDGVLSNKVTIIGNTLSILDIYYFNLIEIIIDTNKGGCYAVFENDWGLNNGENITHFLKKIGDKYDAKLGIDETRKENEIFGKYWEKFKSAIMTGNYAEITKDTDFPIKNDCDEEVYRNRNELNKKLKLMLNSSVYNDLYEQVYHLRIPNHYRKVFGSKYYFQGMMGSIFWDIEGDKVKIKKLDCVFG